MKEKDLQHACIKWAKEQRPDVLVVNIHGGGWSAKGFPDLICCVNGLFVAVELKVGDNTMQPDQLIWRNRIVKAKGIHLCCTSLEQFQFFIDMFREFNKHEEGDTCENH